MKRQACVVVAGVLGVLVGCQAEPEQGIQSREQAIVGGNTALPEAYPWMARVSTYRTPEGAPPFWDFTCGGSLIAPGWVLTAAHCVADVIDQEVVVKDAADMEVVLGEYDLDTTDATEQHRAIAQVIVHPGFQYAEEFDPDLGDFRSIKEFNDIALLRLTTNATLNDAVQVVRLASGGDSPGLSSRVSGWGEDTAGTPKVGSQPVEFLKELSATIVDPNNASDPDGGCDARLIAEAEAMIPGQRATDEATEVCTLNYESEFPDYQSVCYYDSGSPWVMSQGSCSEQFGVHTFGDSFCVSYNVATRVSAYLPWIREQGVDYIGDKVYEAETMFHATGGPHPGGWNIWDNNYISFQHTFSGGQQQVVVRAEGTFAGGQWPRMRVSVGGQTVFETNVTSATWADYSFTFNAPVGSREVQIRFLNDYFQGGADRNLFIDKATIKDARTTCIGDGTIVPTLRITNDWGGGYCAEIQVTNTASIPTADWTLVYNVGNSSVFDSWNPDVPNGTGTKTASPAVGPVEQWLRVIEPGGSRVHGFCANRAPGTTTLPVLVSSDADY